MSILRRPHQLSPKGAKFIGDFEGFSPRASDALDGYCTIGYGHVLHWDRPACTRADRELVWSRRKAAKVLQEDAATVAAHVRRVIKARLSQAQFDALVSIGFNLGTGKVDELARVINTVPGHRIGGVRSNRVKREVTTMLLRWDHSGGVRMPGLTRRRHAEAVLFCTHRYRNRYTG